MMYLQVFGLNHNTASLDIREQVMFTPGLLERAYDDIKRRCQVSEVMLYSTCSRTECIVVTDCIDDVIKWFADFHGIAEELILKHHYHHTEALAVKHLIGVAAGIDSFILGETQILGQLKKAFLEAQTFLSIGQILHRLLPVVFSAAKKIRTETGIGTCTVSLAAAVVQLAKGVFANLEECRVMLIGAGEMITLTATHLHASGVRSWLMVNRTLEKAQVLAEMFSGQAAVIGELPRYLSQVDIIITATASPVPLLGKGLIERTLIQRKHKPLVMADMAMPRDVEPEVARLSDVYLYHIDELHRMVKINEQQRRQSVECAKPIIEEYTERFFAEQRARSSVKTIRQFRAHIDQLRDQAYQEAMADIEQGEVTSEVIRQAFVKLTNKILHTPTIRLRQAASDQDFNVLQTAGYLMDAKVETKEEEVL